MSLEDYWKDDFVPLQAAGREILQQLRNDESAADADLYRRLSTGQHLYFDTADNAFDRVQLQHVQSEPLPPLLSQALAGVKAHSFMGLLAPIHMAWMSVDETLYLWPYGHASGFWTYQVPSGQAIMSVGLVPPTAGTRNKEERGDVEGEPESRMKSTNFVGLTHSPIARRSVYLYICRRLQAVGSILFGHYDSR